MDADRVTIERYLSLFIRPGQVAELRALGVGGNRALCKTFADVAAAAAWAAEKDALGPKGVYFTPNPVRPDLVNSKASTKDVDIVRRHWLLIDCDSVREADTSSTKEERDIAWRVEERCRDVLAAAGLVGPVVGDSGNGFHLCYPIDFPNDSASRALIKATLSHLARCADEAKAVVDTTVHNASRIWKCYGTMARKGLSTAERPHRLSGVLSGQEWEGNTAQENSVALAAWVERQTAAQDMRRGRPQTDKRTYALAALKAELSIMAMAQPGNLNDQLNKSSFNLGQLVATGDLTYEEAFSGMCNAAAQAGCNNPNKDQDTIRRGLRDGMGLPRDMNKVGRNGSTGNGRSTDPHQGISHPRIDPNDVTTIADLRKAGSEIEWLWEGWIQNGVVHAIGALAGTGKTRFCADLVRRIRHGMYWPDGSPMTLPPDSKALWVVADENHDELVSLCEAFAIADVVLVNSSKSDPYAGTTLIYPQEFSALEARVEAIGPALVVIDTVGNATDKNLTKQEDAREFYKPLQKLARNQRCAVLCLTHLNAGGLFLGRRVVEKVRVAIRMDQPMGQERRRLEVFKSNSKKPPPLGASMGDCGNDYDSNPPVAMEHEAQPGATPKLSPKLQQAFDWLKPLLTSGPKRVKGTRTAAEEKGITSKDLYRLRDLKKIEEFEDAEGYKWWKLTSN
jgi:hypothetical protein